MKSQIVLELGSASGVHLRVMGVLKRHGLRVADLAIQGNDAGGKRLTLQVEGEEGGLDLIALYEALSAVDGVDEILRAGQLDSNRRQAGAPTAAEPSREPSAAEKRFKNFDSEAGDEEIRDRMLIFSLLSRYPKISARLVELRGDIPEEDHEERFHQIGVGFGRHLVGNLKVSGPVTDRDAIFDRLFIPAIDPLARVVRVDDLLRLELTRKEFDRGKPSPLHCTFLHGTLRGLLRGAGATPGFEVNKTGCIHHDDTRCEFRLQPGGG